MPIVLWLLGVPLSVVLLLMLFFFFLAQSPKGPAQCKSRTVCSRRQCGFFVCARSRVGFSRGLQTR